MQDDNGRLVMWVIGEGVTSGTMDEFLAACRRGEIEAVRAVRWDPATRLYEWMPAPRLDDHGHPVEPADD